MIKRSLFVTTLFISSANVFASGGACLLFAKNGAMHCVETKHKDRCRELFEKARQNSANEQQLGIYNPNHDIDHWAYEFDGSCN